MPRTSDELLKYFKAQSSLTDGQLNYQDDELFALLDQGVHETLLQLIKAGGEFCVVNSTFNLVANQDSLRLPDAVFSERLRLIEVIEANGGTYDLVENNLSQNSNLAFNGITNYYFMNDKIMFRPPFQLPTQIRLHYYQKPNKLRKSNYFPKIINVIAANQIQITAPFAVDEFLNFTNSFDIIQSNGFIHSQQHNIINFDQTTNTITFANPINNLQVNDFIGLNNTTLYMNLPDIATEYAVIAASIKIAQNRNDENKLKTLYNASNFQLKNIQQLCNNRGERNLTPVRFRLNAKTITHI